MSDASLQFRRARAADLDAIVALLADDVLGSGREDPSVPAADCYVRAFDAIDRDPNQWLAVVERGGAVVGGAGIAPLEGGGADVCELRKMYFLPGARGIGAGAAMMRRCLDAARAHGFRRCYLETLAGMHAAQALYRRSGFTPLCAPMGGTGHFGCDRFFIREL